MPIATVLSHLLIRKLAAHAKVEHVHLAQLVQLGAADRVVARLDVTMKVANAVQICEDYGRFEQILDTVALGRLSLRWALLGYGSFGKNDRTFERLETLDAGAERRTERHVLARAGLAQILYDGSGLRSAFLFDGPGATCRRTS